MKSLALSLALGLGLATGAAALELDLPGEETRLEAGYVCENGQTLAVEFIIAGENALALVRVDGGDPILMANVVSASGARYTGGLYELWQARGEVSFLRYGEEPTICQPQD